MIHEQIPLVNHLFPNQATNLKGSPPRFETNSYHVVKSPFFIPPNGE